MQRHRTTLVVGAITLIALGVSRHAHGVPIATLQDGSLGFPQMRMIDPNTGDFGVLFVGGGGEFAITPDETFVLAGATSVREVDRTGTLVAEYPSVIGGGGSIAAAPNGDLYVTRLESTGVPPGPLEAEFQIVRIDRDTGSQSMVFTKTLDVNDPLDFFKITRLHVGPDGTLFGTKEAVLGAWGVIQEVVSIDPTMGALTTLLVPTCRANDIAVEPTGTLLVAGGCALVRIDPATGASTNLYPPMNPLVSGFARILVGEDGTIVAADGAFVVEIDPVSLAVEILPVFPSDVGIGVNVEARAAPDSDGDDVSNFVDNCSTVANGADEPGNQVDYDQDGYGNACDCDFFNTGFCGTYDAWVFVWCSEFTTEPACAETDMNGNGALGAADQALPGPTDLDLFNQAAGTGPGPSGLNCAGSTPCTFSFDSQDP